jgi:hypothetical protein
VGFDHNAQGREKLEPQEPVVLLLKAVTRLAREERDGFLRMSFLLGSQPLALKSGRMFWFSRDISLCRQVSYDGEDHIKVFRRALERETRNIPEACLHVGS